MLSQSIFSYPLFRRGKGEALKSTPSKTIDGVNQEEVTFTSFPISPIFDHNSFMFPVMFISETGFAIAPFSISKPSVFKTDCKC